MTDDEEVDARRREHPRFAVEVWVDFSTLDVQMSSHVLNLSQGGVFIQSDRPLPLDAEVNLVLWLPGGRPIHGRGRVVWNYDLREDAPRREGGSGIQFVDISPADRALLEDYLRSLTRSEPDDRGH